MSTGWARCFSNFHKFLFQIAQTAFCSALQQHCIICMHGSMAQHLMLKADFISPFQLASAAGSLAPTLDRQMTFEPCCMSSL